MRPDDLRVGELYRFRSGRRRVLRIYGHRSYRVVEWEPEKTDGFARSTQIGQFAKRIITDTGK